MSGWIQSEDGAAIHLYTGSQVVPVVPDYLSGQEAYEVRVIIPQGEVARMMRLGVVRLGEHEDLSLREHAAWVVRELIGDADDDDIGLAALSEIPGCGHDFTVEPVPATVEPGGWG